MEYLFYSEEGLAFPKNDLGITKANQQEASDLKKTLTEIRAHLQNENYDYILDHLIHTQLDLALSENRQLFKDNAEKAKKIWTEEVDQMLSAQLVLKRENKNRNYFFPSTLVRDVGWSFVFEGGQFKIDADEVGDLYQKAQYRVFKKTLQDYRYRIFIDMYRDSMRLAENEIDENHLPVIRADTISEAENVIHCIMLVFNEYPDENLFSATHQSDVDWVNMSMKPKRGIIDGVEFTYETQIRYERIDEKWIVTSMHPVYRYELGGLIFGQRSEPFIFESNAILDRINEYRFEDDFDGVWLIKFDDKFVVDLRRGTLHWSRF